MIRSARDPGWLAAGNAVSLLSVTQNPRHESHQAQREMPRQCPAAFLAGLILPHQEMTGGPMGKFRPSVVTVCDQAVSPLVGAHLYHRRMPGSTTGRGRLVHPAPPDHHLPARTGRPPGHLRGLPRPGAARVRPLLPVRPARPARPGPARRRRGAHLLRGEGHRVRRRPVALQVLARRRTPRRGPRCWPCCSPSCTTTAAACGGTRACPPPAAWPWCRPAAAARDRTRCSSWPPPTCGCR